MADSRFKPRAIMEKAVEVMLQSVAEPRADGKASPKVGAVLVTSAELLSSMGPLVTACRGGLREGDHAEFTLIERKCRDRNLAGSVLFATLEPCAPGARRHPKLGCAERIVLARIKEVWVGIEDPDPTVDRKVAKITEDVGTRSFHRRLALQGLLKENMGQWDPTGFGLLLFGKEPRLHMRQAGLLGTIHYADGREEPKDFDGPQVFAPDLALQWLRDKLPDPADRREARRNSVNEDEREGWERITTLGSITKASYTKATGYGDRKAQRHLKHFVDLGLLRRVGSGKATTYEIDR